MTFNVDTTKIPKRVEQSITMLDRPYEDSVCCLENQGISPPWLIKVDIKHNLGIKLLQTK